MSASHGALRLLCAAVCTAAVLPAQSAPFASRVVAFDDMGQAGGGIFMPSSWLGAPDGSVGSLGVGGWAALGFDVVIADGPGADLIVSENGFYTAGIGEAYVEVAFVEVSTDGVTFARLPNAYYGAPASPGPFGVLNVGFFAGLAGATPPNPSAPDPQDVVQAGGDALDLADLQNDPLVLSGAVDLQRITQVRLVDARDGIDRDSRGVLIRDPSAGSADMDAVTAIHFQGGIDPRGPRVDVVVPADGRFEITVEDPDGWIDLDPTALRAALWGVPLPLADLLPYLDVTRFDPLGFTLKLRFPLPSGLPLRVSASAKDRGGNRSGDTRTRPLS